MPARGPFLARAPLRSLSPVFGGREEREPEERLKVEGGATRTEGGARLRRVLDSVRWAPFVASSGSTNGPSIFRRDGPA